MRGVSRSKLLKTIRFGVNGSSDLFRATIANQFPNATYSDNSVEFYSSVERLPDEMQDYSDETVSVDLSRIEVADPNAQV